MEKRGEAQPANRKGRASAKRRSVPTAKGRASSTENTLETPTPSGQNLIDPPRPMSELILGGVAIAAAVYAFAALPGLRAFGSSITAAGAFLAYVTWHRKWARRIASYFTAVTLVVIGTIFIFAFDDAKPGQNQSRNSAESPDARPDRPISPTSAGTQVTASPALQNFEPPSPSTSEGSAARPLPTPIYVEAERSVTLFEGSFRISVVAMAYDGSPLRHNATVVLSDITTGESKRVERWETGTLVKLGPYSVTILSEGTFGATFEVRMS